MLYEMFRELRKNTNSAFYCLTTVDEAIDIFTGEEEEEDIFTGKKTTVKKSREKEIFGGDDTDEIVAGYRNLDELIDANIGILSLFFEVKKNEDGSYTVYGVHPWAGAYDGEKITDMKDAGELVQMAMRLFSRLRKLPILTVMSGSGDVLYQITGDDFKQSANKDELILLVPENLVGYVIGKEGRNVKALSKLFWNKRIRIIREKPIEIPKNAKIKVFTRE